MTWLVVVPLALALWWLYDIRQALRLRLRVRPGVVVEGPSYARPETFQGAVTTRYVVVRWPGELVHYAGNNPTLAKQTYEAEAPIPGEALELWDGATCRSHKAM